MSLSLQLSDTRVYEPQIRARLGTTAHLCTVAARKLGALGGGGYISQGVSNFVSEHGRICPDLRHLEP